MKIGVKLLIVGALILLLPLGALGVLITVQASSGIKATQVGNLDNLSKSMALYTENRLEGDMRTAMALANDQDVRRAVQNANAGIGQKPGLAELTKEDYEHARSLRLQESP
jgi:hypothetical protein